MKRPLGLLAITRGLFSVALSCAPPSAPKGEPSARTPSEARGIEQTSDLGTILSNAAKEAANSNELPSASRLSSDSEASQRSPPPALVSHIATKPYVEANCTKAATAELPTALSCHYEVMGLAANVVVANPSAEQVVHWAIDAASYAEPLEAIRIAHPDHWLRGVKAFVTHVKHQSSRIFPIAGEIIEDLGHGPTRFTFDRGVVTPCEHGNCRCRINSINPAVYCRFEEAQGGDRKRCLERYEGQAGDQAWRNTCQSSHVEALRVGYNKHFRARAFVVGEQVKAACTTSCTPERIALLIEKQLKLR